MTRDMRFRVVGVFFYLLLLLSLGLTKSGMESLRELFSCGSNLQSLQIVISLAGLGALLFTSDAMGYFFGTVFHRIWDYHGGWSRFWRDLGIKDSFQRAHDRKHAQGGSSLRSEACRRPADFPEDLYFSYFWQRVPQGRREWAMRRHLRAVPGAG